MNLTIYDFHKILKDLDGLTITNYHKDEYWTCPQNGNCYRFNWEWHDYSGTGAVHLINGIVDANEEFCKESCLYVSKESKRQATKYVSEVYNEPELVDLMQYIANTHKLKGEKI